MNTATETKGMPIDVYRAVAYGGDCTNGGVSSTHDTLTLVGVLDQAAETVTPVRDLQIFSPTPAVPAVALRITRHAWPRESTVAAIVPVTWDAERGAYLAPERRGMFGGNYAAATDSRWHATVSAALGAPWRGALPIHDRTE